MRRHAKAILLVLSVGLLAPGALCRVACAEPAGDVRVAGSQPPPCHGAGEQAPAPDGACPESEAGGCSGLAAAPPAASPDAPTPSAILGVAAFDAPSFPLRGRTGVRAPDAPPPRAVDLTLRDAVLRL